MWPNINSDASHRLLEDSEKRDKNCQEIEKERLREERKKIGDSYIDLYKTETKLEER
jgi:hypothetical protein